MIDNESENGVLTKIVEGARPLPSRSRRRFGKGSLAFAACLGMLAGVGTFTFWLQQSRKLPQQQPTNVRQLPCHAGPSGLMATFKPSPRCRLQ